jgi:hypothetical protein
VAAEETPDGDELRGADQPPLRVPAAQQGLDTLQAASPAHLPGRVGQRAPGMPRPSRSARSSRVNYGQLLEIFWHNIDPLTPNAQFCDHDNQYRSAIFHHDDEEKRLADASKLSFSQSGRFKAPIVTEIVAAGAFYPAEEYHQNYYRKNPVRYKFYK